MNHIESSIANELIMYRYELRELAKYMYPCNRIKAFYSTLIKLKDMLRYTIIFLVIALIAGVLGFGGIAGAAAGIAQIFFYIFIVLAVIWLIRSLL